MQAANFTGRQKRKNPPPPPVFARLEIFFGCYTRIPAVCGSARIRCIRNANKSPRGRLSPGAITIGMIITTALSSPPRNADYSRMMRGIYFRRAIIVRSAPPRITAVPKHPRIPLPYHPPASPTILPCRERHRFTVRKRHGDVSKGKGRSQEREREGIRRRRNGQNKDKSKSET